MNIYSSIIMAIILSIVSIPSIASHSVRGYYRGNGTYVQPHMSMDPYEARNSGYSYHNDQLVSYNSHHSNSGGYGMRQNERY